MKFYFYNNNLINPKGVIQIIHGMSEHSKRYLALAQFFHENSYLVALSDHRSHGEEAIKNNSLGILNCTFKDLVQDQLDITKEIYNLYPNLPIYILGHSMGSFIAQGHMKLNNISGNYILSGSCGDRSPLYFLGASFFKTLSFFSRTPKKLYNSILFFNFNYNWLSKNKINITQYEKDPLCGFSYNSKFYYEFLYFLSNLFKEKDFTNVNRSIPICILSGKEDPIGLYGKGVKKLFNFYSAMKFDCVTIKLFPQLKHEVLQESEEYFVKEFLLDWINSKNKKVDS